MGSNNSTKNSAPKEKEESKKAIINHISIINKKSF